MRKRQKIFSTHRPFSNARRSRIWPYAMLALAIGVIALLVWVMSAFVFPFLGSVFRGEQTAFPSPTPEEQQVGDLTDHIREVLLTNQFRYVSKPALIGDEIFFASGADNALNPALVNIYRSTAATSNSEVPKKVEGIAAQNDNILSVAVSADFIVYFDAKDTGGGTIMAFNRNDNTVTPLKTVLYGVVNVYLEGQWAFWIERTATDTYKLYMMNVKNQELTTLAVYTDSPMGLSEPGVCDTEIAFVEADPDRANSEQYNRIVRQSLTTGEKTTFDPGMYAFHPVTNGSALAWSDHFGAADSTLYLSVDGSMPRKMAENVSEYGLGQNFLAWCENGQIWAYYYKEDALYRVSKPAEYAQLETVSDHGVAWRDVTDEKRERDILKFAGLD